MIPTPKIEIYANITSTSSVYFELDDNVLGILDSEYVLAGPQWADITARAKSYSINRGKTSIFGYNSAGQLSVQLNNHDRAFDPTWADSVLYGAVVPQIPVRVSINDVVQFTGTIDDWDLSYTPSYDNIASFTATDAFADWATKTIGEYTPASLQLTSNAIAEALGEIGITQDPPSPATGIVMGTALVPANTNALQYVQKLATSDFGNLYIKKDGSWDYAPFSRRITGVISTRIAPDTDKPIHLASVAYGTENLYNQVVITYADTGETITVAADDSVASYGTRVLTDSGSLISGGLFGLYGQVKAQEILEIYASPELRFDSIELYLHDYSEAKQNEILALELGDRVIASFDPTNTGNPITRIGKIIAVSHKVTTQEHTIQFKFESSSTTPLVVGDPEFGRLDAGNFLERTWDFSI